MSADTRPMSCSVESMVMLSKAPWGEAAFERSETNLKDNYITSPIKVELCEDEHQTKGQNIRRKDFRKNFPER